MLNKVKRKNRNEIIVPTYNELSKTLQKKKENENTIKLSKTMKYKSKLNDDLSSNYSSHKNSIISKNETENSFSIKRTKTENLNSKNYNIQFKENSSNNIIEHDINIPSHCKINLLFSEENEINQKKQEINELKDNIKKLEDKIKNANEQFDNIKNNISEMTEENFKLISERKKEERQHELNLKHIPMVKEDINNIKLKIENAGIEKVKYKKEIIEVQKEINLIEEKMKEMNVKIEKQIKENAKIKHKLKIQQDKNNELKKLINPYSGQSSNFINDITSLIPPKNKDENKIISNTLA